MPLKKHYDTRIREYLRTNEDGATVAEIALMLEVGHQVARHAVRAMPDVYIDRWEDNGLNTWQAVYCLADIPEDKPQPAGRPWDRRPALQSARAAQP